MSETTPKKPEVFLIAAQTADGFIARESNEFANWTSKEDKQRFIALTKEAGVMIMGATTFRTFQKPLKDRHHVIYSRTEKFEVMWPDGNVETTTLSPKEIIDSLVKRGYTKIAICGGASIYSLFIQSGLVSKLYLTVEPIVFGQGIKLFSEVIEGDLKLTLDKEERTESGTVFLDYSVIQN